MITPTPKRWDFPVLKSRKRKRNMRTIELTLEMCERFFEERNERLMARIVRGAMRELKRKD